MEYIEGHSLEQALPALTTIQIGLVAEALGVALRRLRSLEPLGFVGKTFYTLDPLPGVVKGTPLLTTIADFLRSTAALLKTVQKPQLIAEYAQYFRRMRDQPLHFTHMCLRTKNIMLILDPVATNGGSLALSVKILSWRNSGWFPACFESCNARLLSPQEYPDFWYRDILSKALKDKFDSDYHMLTRFYREFGHSTANIQKALGLTPPPDSETWTYIRASQAGFDRAPWMLK